MKKTLSIILAVVLSLGMLAGCGTKTETESKEPNANIISPLPETLDINALDNCTVAISLENGGVYVNDSGKMVMDVTVYSYELYDMVDIASLKENDVILRKNEEVKVTEIERLETGLVRINGGEAYYELGNVTLPVSDEFEYVDESDLDVDAKKYFAEDFLKDDSGIEYNFSPNNTSIVIENGTIIKMNKTYMP